MKLIEAGCLNFFLSVMMIMLRSSILFLFFYIISYSEPLFFVVVCRQGIMKTLSVNKMTSAGCKVKILVADCFAQLNNKMGGDLKKIETVGHYLIEIWKAAGMDLNRVEFLWSSKEINSRASEYWSLVIKIALRTNLHRIMR